MPLSYYPAHVPDLNIDWLSLLQSVDVYMVSSYTIMRTVFLVLKCVEILLKHKILKQMLSTGKKKEHR